ncbi:MAG: UDP-N-acetylmuramate dehydrogenase [Leptolyngbyaceae cyanobacterium MO_188.B28]|nr:UDP-N-acetylmuramate dehydrogenase [Leptolyngbyaceae cyanobacterium MO_188.B28]
METNICLPDVNSLIKSQVPLAGLTSFRVGGPAEWYIAPQNIEELQTGLEWAQKRDLPITFLGAGSNLLVSDCGLPGLVICTRRLRQATFDPDTGQVTAAAGEPLATLAWKAARLGWKGLEWAVGIPGTVGGAVVMNAGAHGWCTEKILVQTKVLNSDQTTAILSPEDLGYQYRTSRLQHDQQLVVQATFQLQPGANPKDVIADTSKDLAQRRATQPYHLPSCGSVFRNPDAHSAGWLIEQTGLKGRRIGNAQVAHRHANFILNCGGATANDILELIHHVQHEVESRWSLFLKPEVKFLGEFQPV